MAKLTAATVNAELKRLGFAERLFRGKGCYYFYDGDAHKWPSCSVYVYYAHELTLNQWIETYHYLKNSQF